MTETDPPPQRCGRLAIGFKVTCDLPKRHVTAEDDWHEATARTTQLTASYSHETTEVIRWRPEQYEVPPKLDA